MAEGKEGSICVACGARCCRYMAVEIDRPACKQEYDHIRWHLLHKGVNVFVDNDNDWCLEFETTCLELGDDQRCGNYDNRPMICREHGDDESDKSCEFVGGESPHKLHFSTAKEFEDFLDSRGIEWRN